ncbi:small integral membrane protein 8 [Folsomia candida]|uniref:small integral membrane protein 8 n=1 Tax=Folsomia candida TaxID=158441 RepID=UPI000B905F16|nr:small integral membrane protein 8 [Folsomia candida]
MAEKGSDGKPVERVPGEGIRSMKTSNAFRALNFELYAKPNKKIMGLGIVGIICAASYLFYINYEMYDRNKFYYAENEDGSRTARPKTSRWDS